MHSLRAYLDHNASAPLIGEARAAMVAALDVAGNASSVHAEGREARRLVEAGRREVAALCNGEPANVVFTSGATEAAAHLVTPDWRMGRAPLRFSRLYAGATEHPCILSGGRFSEDAVVRIGVDRDGLLDLGALAEALGRHDMAEGLPLVAVQAANNETGVIQPLGQVAAAMKAAGGVLVVDAVQAAGRILLDISDDCGDFFILSSHKIGGPKGVGAFIARSDLLMPAPLVRGGGQERGFRAGTENVAAIAGFGAAAAVAKRRLGEMDRVASLRQRLEEIVTGTAPDAIIFGAGAPRLANTLLFGIPGLKTETAQIAFDLAGVAVSAGSACSSGKLAASPVLGAMGFAEMAALRVSLGHSTTEAEIEMFADAFGKLVSRHARETRAA